VANNGKRLQHYRGDLYHRHYCRSCGQRVYPYDSLEALTVAPEAGARGGPILLYSANSRKARTEEGPGRLAWCWSENKWVETYRETRFDTMLRYLKRNGVEFRFRGKSVSPADLPERRMTEALEQRIEERRPTAIIPSTKRMKGSA